MQPQFFKQFSTPIRSVIFDLGGVILPIDYQLTIEKFQEIGFTNFQETFTQAAQNLTFDLLDKGLITPAAFRNEIRDLAAKNISDVDIDEAWNAMLLDFIPSRLQVLEQVKKRYNTYLLSNTNEMSAATIPLSTPLIMYGLRTNQEVAPTNFMLLIIKRLA